MSQRLMQDEERQEALSQGEVQVDVWKYPSLSIRLLLPQGHLSGHRDNVLPNRVGDCVR